MKNLTKLTSEQIKRTNNSLIETQRMLDKELSYSKDLQNTSRITYLESHVVVLNNLLLNGWVAPTC